MARAPRCVRPRRGLGSQLLGVEPERIDLARLEQAAQRLVSRHDMLRAVILDDGRQQVLESLPGPFVEIVDLRGLSGDDVEAQLLATREAMSGEVLPADTAPLFRVVAHVLDGDITRLHVGVDMLIVDATSLLMLMSELGAYLPRAGPGAGPHWHHLPRLHHH